MIHEAGLSPETENNTFSKFNYSFTAITGDIKKIIVVLIFWWYNVKNEHRVVCSLISFYLGYRGKQGNDKK